jgi:glycosyltransferase involved in cell wall biosynthesis
MENYKEHIKKDPNILIIIPAFNESENILKLLESINTSIRNQMNLDVLVVNDCSIDNTSHICKRNGFNVIDLPCNLGIGGAVQTGYKYAQKNNYDIAIQVDGDGQHDPEYIHALIKPILQKKADMVIGSRYINKEGFQSTFLRRIGINYFSKLISILSNQKVTDPTSGFRASNKKVIELFSKRYPIDYPEPESIVFLKRKGLNIVELPVKMNERRGGISSINIYRSIYYVIKVSMAILIDKLRKQPL